MFKNTNIFRFIICISIDSMADYIMAIWPEIIVHMIEITVRFGKLVTAVNETKADTS